MLSDGDGSPAVFFLCGTGPAGKASVEMLQPAWQTGRLLLTGEMRHEGSWQNMMSAQTLLEAGNANPDADRYVHDDSFRAG